MVVRLKNYISSITSKEIDDFLSKYEYAFNPSYLYHENINYLALRVFDPQRQSIISLLICWNKNGKFKFLDLSNYFNKEKNINKVADPKLFIMNNKVYGTFNTGFVSKNKNSVFLFEIKGININNFFLCNYNNRKLIEKNWAFYNINTNIFVLYSINPLKILKLKEKCNDQINFIEHYVGEKNTFKNYTIGTQLIKKEGSYLFIAHKKIYKNGKRLYLGRPFCLNLTKKPQITAKKKYLIHSFSSLFGNKHKFNKNLISCSYFSGIHIKGKHVYLGYGVNDASWKIAKINMKKLWQ